MARRDCRRKKIYPSEGAAQARAEQRAVATGEPISAYYDPLCGHWHIGHPIGYRRAQKLLKKNPMQQPRRA